MKCDLMKNEKKREKRLPKNGKQKQKWVEEKKAELIVSELIINNKSNFSMSSLKITLPKL